MKKRAPKRIGSRTDRERNAALRAELERRAAKRRAEPPGRRS
jgi:hypothetical protein